MTLPLQLLLTLFATAVAVALFVRLGLSAILGYLFVGALVGPGGLGLLTDAPTLQLLAEIGVVLLMFTVGLEFSLSRLLASRRLVLGLGGAQVLACTAVFGLGAWALGGLRWEIAALLGAALAMSSTAIVLKQLAEQLELATEHGRVATAVLLLQDLAAVPLLVVVPILARGGDTTLAIGMALLKGAGVFLVLVLLGRFVLPRALGWVASLRSLELFMISSLLLALLAAEIAAAADLSPTLGAFMAGMLLGETPFRHQVEADVRPFRDLMLGVFFVGIGLQFDPRVFVHAPLAVALVFLAASPLKAAIIAALCRSFGGSAAGAVRSGIVLAQGGEFGLLVVAALMQLGLLEPAIGQPVLAGVIATMVAAPLAVRYNERLARPLVQRPAADAVVPVPATIAETDLEDFEHHVLIAGFGRVGQNLALLLDQEGIPNLAMDLDPERVREARQAGLHVVYGDATHRDILVSVGLERARAVAITFGDAHAAEHAVHTIRTLRRDLPVLARSVHPRDEQRLREAGAEVFAEGPEMSLAFTAQLLLLLGRPPVEVEALQSRIRASDYGPLRTFFHGEDATGDEDRDYPEQLAAHVLQEGEYAVGRRLDELPLPDLGVDLALVWRGALRIPPAAANFRLRPHDVLVLRGSADALERAERWLRSGERSPSAED